MESPFASHVSLLAEFQRHLVFTLCVIAFLCYLAAVRQLRWRRYIQIHRQYQHKYELGGTLTPEDAQRVVELCLSYDMPMLMRYALSLALFKTYAIPSISKILKGTREMGSSEGISKRFADTEILIGTVLACPITGRSFESRPDSPKTAENDSEACAEVPLTKIDDPRAMIALARVNWLHSKYPIKNEDYLYTLGLAIFEPERWARLYGWRELSALECHALYVFWVEVGKRMGLKDIPQSSEEFKEWCLSYQQYEMVPAQSSHDVANITLEEFIRVLPTQFGIRNFAKGVAISLLEDVVREAMMLPAQPWYHRAFVDLILHSINFVQLYLCLPRRSPEGPVDGKLPDFARNYGCPYDSHDGEFFSTKPLNKDSARMRPNNFQIRPWYKPESNGFLRKLSDKLRVSLGLFDEMPGRGSRSQGYRLEELGPLRYEKDGHEEVIRNAEKLLGVPITGPWAAL
ncbi:hypothetical protein K435DRAFT_717880 [Dendrothele bispora CBS 962.96]|uniref:ER-bound oxygenase mpaB/mpaB'/Rubber oxygenase catalytic domain-containing protein n=1 Tax=Dendrothele bispora (strain CBS 962.96) TaxID=1314807 RepID=A0A4S8MH28_DENBC|nr:hypothetical protein K435DRAFT_717880 [Dendrothele bispora CBS 962.96]